MKTKAILILFFLFPILKSFGQEITQLGVWNNNANFTARYYQDRLITSTTSGIVFLDVSDPANPVPSASLSNPSSFPMAIEIDGNYAYFGGGMVGYFMIADISNINFPVQIGITNNINGTAYQIAIKEDFAFMPTNQGVFYSMDISDKSSPVVIDDISMGGFSSGVAIKGNYAYVGTESGLKIVNISDPSNLAIIGTFGGNYRRITHDEDYDRLIVAKNGLGFDVIDISDPLVPVGLFQGIGGVSTGNLCYLNGLVFQIGPGNVSAFQISNSSSTYLTSFSSTITGQVNDVSVKDSIFYLSTVNDVHVLKLSMNTTGVPNNIESDRIDIFPNPTLDFITLVLDMETIDYRIEIYNSRGQKVRNIENSARHITFNLSGMEAGIYFVRVKSNRAEKVFKFIKQ